MNSLELLQIELIYELKGSVFIFGAVNVPLSVSSLFAHYFTIVPLLSRYLPLVSTSFLSLN
jgi:hypothetical protein